MAAEKGVLYSTSLLNIQFTRQFKNCHIRSCITM